MRGSPVLRGIAVIAALLLLLIPILRTTAPRKAATVTKAPPARVQEIHLTVTCSAVPFSYSLSHLGNVIWSGRSEKLTAEKSVSMPFPSEGVDLLLDASWSSDSTGAVRLDVQKPDGTTASQTIWGDGEASDVLTFR